MGAIQPSGDAIIIGSYNTTQVVNNDYIYRYTKDILSSISVLHNKRDDKTSIYYLGYAYNRYVNYLELRGIFEPLTSYVHTQGTDEIDIFGYLGDDLETIEHWKFTDKNGSGNYNNLFRSDDGILLYETPSDNILYKVYANNTDVIIPPKRYSVINFNIQGITGSNSYVTLNTSPSSNNGLRYNTTGAVQEFNYDKNKLNLYFNSKDGTIDSYIYLSNIEFTELDQIPFPDYLNGDGNVLIGVVNDKAVVPYNTESPFINFDNDAGVQLLDAVYFKFETSNKYTSKSSSGTLIGPPVFLGNQGFIIGGPSSFVDGGGSFGGGG